MDVQAVLGRLGEAADELLAADPDAMADAELHEAVVGLWRLRDRLAAAQAQLLRRWHARAVWAADGSRASWARLSRETGCAGATARREITRAEALGRMPAVSAAFARGEVSADVASLFAEAAGSGREALVARDEEMLLERVEGLYHNQVRRVLAYWCQLADEDLGEDEARRLHEGRWFSASASFEGWVELAGRLDPIAGEVVINELERIEAELRRAGRSDDEATAPSQRRADALVEMARRSAAASAAARPPAPLVSLFLGYETFVGRVCETARGTVVPPDLVRAWLAEADIERIVFAGPSRVMDVGAHSRFFTGATRRAVEVRDRHCTTRDATCRPIAARSTTSCPGRQAARPPRPTGGSCVPTTTAGTTTTTSATGRRRKETTTSTPGEGCSNLLFARRLLVGCPDIQHAPSPVPGKADACPTSWSGPDVSGRGRRGTQVDHLRRSPVASPG